MSVGNGDKGFQVFCRSVVSPDVLYHELIRNEIFIYKAKISAVVEVYNMLFARTGLKYINFSCFSFSALLFICSALLFI